MKTLTEIFKTKENLKDINTNHVFCVDVSGSMSGSLPKMREHIKNNFALLVKPKDTVSIIYFSSKGQYGVVFENQAINTLQDLSLLNKSVDRFLTPMGLTGFLEPIQESIDCVSRINNGNVNSFIFMTDGYDNQWSEKDILNTCELLPKSFHNIVFIEYGYYCNTKLLEKMVNISGGFHVFSEGYDNYKDAVEHVLSNNLSNNINIEVYGKKVFYIKDDELYVKDIKEDNVTVPDNLDNLYVIETDTVDESVFSSYTDEVKYSLLYMAVDSMNSDETWKILKLMGDVNFIKQYANCFSKQDYVYILKNIKDCIINPDLRYSEGINFSLVPKDDAFTVVDLIDILANSDNKLMLGDKNFKYSRIGAETVEVSKEDKITTLKEQLSETTDIDKIKEIAEEITLVQDSVTFYPYSAHGVNINSVVYNESRPNISISTNQQGFVELSPEVSDKFSLPTEFKTSITKSYTIVKDGIKNMKVLPVQLDIDTFAKLQVNGLLIDERYKANKTYTIDITNIPLINRNMVSTVNATEYFSDCFELLKLKALQKVYKHKLDSYKTSADSSFVSVYGLEASEYLDSIGIKSYGFSPKVKANKSGDFYYSKELNIKISGASSLPAINATLKKKADGKKINLADQLILDSIEAVESMLYNLCDETIKETLEVHTKRVISQVRKLQYTMNKSMYAIVVGKVWFKGFDDVDNTSMNFNYNGIDYTIKAVLEEKEVKI